MINLKNSLIVLFAIVTSNAICQSQERQIKGVVYEAMDSTGLEFAHIYLKNSFIGTYTNVNGEFSFNYPDSIEVDTLIVSRVGYNNVTLPLTDSTKNTQMKLFLIESKNYLDEVVIYSKKDTVRVIVKDVLKNFRKNYPTKIHYLEGFYRELSLKGDEYTRLIEASVGVTENSYRLKKTNSKIKVRQIRKSEDYRDYDWKRQMYSKVMTKLMKLMWEEVDYNKMFKLLSANIAKMDRGNIHLFAKENDFLDAFDFEVEKISIEGDNKLYHISFQRPPSTSSAIGYYSGKMVVNMDDLAIVEWTFGVTHHPYKSIPQMEHMFYKERFQSQSHLIYSKIDGKYYPTFFEMYRPILEASNHVYEDGREELQFDKITFMVNQVVSRKRDFERIKKREALEDELDLYDLDHPYDADFWANYNLLLLDPLLKPAIKDLEKEKSLESQFEGNGE